LIFLVLVWFNSPMTNCTKCKNGFEITDKDRAFYKKIQVPHPTLCPDCRTQRRMSFRNERNLYHDKCDLCGDKMISAYKPGHTMPVYCNTCWWGDDWDPESYGVEVDVAKPFFPQYKALMDKVPRLNLALVKASCANADFNNYVAYAKNTYLCAGSVHVEDCMYGNPYESKDCTDSFLVRLSELCYEGIDLMNCYNCNYCQNCENSNDCWFCYECYSCKDCIGCTGLSHKQYYIANKKYSEEEYLKMKNSLKLNTAKGVSKARDYLATEEEKFPRRGLRILKSEDCTGNYIVNSKNCHDCFDIKDCWDCGYCAQIIDMKDCYDTNYCEHAELLYEHLGYCDNYNLKFSLIPGNCKNGCYLDFCSHCNDCFGCISMKKKNFCILNKEYSEKEYKKLVGELIEAMTKRGEYGEFWPSEFSPFGYWETAANDYFPESS